MAPEVGLEPTTLRLTAECSAIELLRNIREMHDMAVGTQLVITNASGGVKGELAKADAVPNEPLRSSPAGSSVARFSANPRSVPGRYSPETAPRLAPS